MKTSRLLLLITIIFALLVIFSAVSQAGINPRTQIQPMTPNGCVGTDSGGLFFIIPGACQTSGTGTGGDGNVIYGTIAPVSTQGNQGDFYVLVTGSSMCVYGPKITTGWGVSCSTISGGGVTPTFSIGTVTSGAAGSTPVVTLTGTPPAYVINLQIPAGAIGSGGANGSSPTITIGTVTTLAAGASATATLGGTYPSYSLNLGIPQGIAGTGGGSSVTIQVGGTNTSSQTVLNFTNGAGTTVSSSSGGVIQVAVNYGTTSGTAAQGNDSRFPTCTGSGGSQVCTYSGGVVAQAVAADTSVSAPNINGLITPIGLDPTGTNDNSPSFQTAVNLSHTTGVCVSIPPGVYKLLTPVTFAGGECISGYNGSKGAQGVTLKPTTAAFVTSAPLSQLQNVAIHDFNIQGGTNPIDLGEFHFITIYNMTFQDYTGWAISTVRGERHELSNIFCFHSTVSAQGCLSLGDFNNSIFASTYTAASFNDPWWDKSLVMDIVDQGVSATISDQYTIWSNAGASGYQTGSVNNSIFQNITSRIAGQTAQVRMYNVFNSEFHNLITDGDGTSASPIPVVFNVPGTFQDSTLDQSSPAYAGTNYFTTGAFFGQFNNSHISRSYMLGNNTTSYGIVFASNYGNSGSIDSYTGAIYNQSANRYWQNNITVTGSLINANNAGSVWGQNIHDGGGLGVAVTLAGIGDPGNDSVAATSSFQIIHNLGGGTGNVTFAVTPSGPVAPQGKYFLTSGSYQVTLQVPSSLTQNVAVTFPNAASNTIQPQLSATGSDFVQYIDANGVQHLAVPMVWPTMAGIPYWTSGTAWGGAYNATTPIPANYVATIPYSQLSGTPTIPAPLPELVAQPTPASATFLQAINNAANQPVHIAIFGDSFAITDHTNLPSTPTGATISTNRWAEQVRIHLQAIYGSHGTGVYPLNFGVSGSPGIFLNSEAWSCTGTYSMDTSTLGPTNTYGTALIHLSNGAICTFHDSRNIAWDTINTYCMTNSSSGSIAVSVDGGAYTGTACGTTSGSATAHVVSLAANISTSHTVTFTSTGNSYLYAAEGQSGTTGVSVDNMAIGGSDSRTFGTNPATQLAFSDLIPGGTQAVIYMGMTNDAALGLGSSAFSTNLQAVITHEQALASNPTVMLAIPPVDIINTLYPETTYTAAQLALCASNSLTCINIQSRWGTSYVSTNGLWDLTGSTYPAGPSGVHPNDKGNLDEAQMIYAALVNPTAAATTTGVTSLDGNTGAFTFGGPGVSHSGTAYTFSGGGSNPAQVVATSTPQAVALGSDYYNNVSGAMEFDLPTITSGGVGAVTCLYNNTANNSSISLYPPSGVTVDWMGASTTGRVYSAGALGDSICLKAASTTLYKVDRSVGSWNIATGVVAPSFSPVAGIYQGSQSVTLSTTTTGATICDSTNGTTLLASPAGTCNVISGENSLGVTPQTITVASSQTVTALATKTGLGNSTVASSTYTIAQDYATFAASGTFTAYTDNFSKTFAYYAGAGSTGSLVFTGGGVTASATEVFPSVLSSLTPSSPNYQVTVTFVVPTNTDYQVSVFARANSSALTMLDFVCNNTGACVLYSFVSGVSTVLGTYSYTWPNGSSHTLTIYPNGTMVTCSLDGVPVITATGYSAITAAGQAGFQVAVPAPGTGTPPTASNWIVQ